MTDTALPFFIRGHRAGTVADITEHPGFFRGRLSLSDFAEAELFVAAIQLARDVNDADPKDYQAKWDRWNRTCSELQDLHLWIGTGPTQVEEFSIESDWSIEWRNMDEEFVGL